MPHTRPSNDFFEIPGAQANVDINFDKEFDIRIVGGIDAATVWYSDNWKKTDKHNWRLFNKTDPLPPKPANPYKVLQVDERILLMPENTTLDFSYKHTTEDALGPVIEKGGNGMVAKTAQLLDGLRSAASAIGSIAGMGGGYDPGTFKSRYAVTQAWTSTSALQMPSSIKFVFRFGQAGLFNGMEEVVKPVLALAACNAISQVDGSDNRFTGPVPTVSYFITEFVVKFAKAASDVISTKVNTAADRESGNDTTAARDTDPPPPDPPPVEQRAIKPSSIEKAIELATAIEEAAMNSYNYAVSQAMSTSRLFEFRRGRATWGPCLVKEVKWGFDFNEVDDKGCPTYGYVELNDISKLRMASLNDIVKTFPVPSD